MGFLIYKYGEKYFKRKPVNPDGYSVAEMFGCTEKDEMRFGLRYFFTYCKKWPPREGAVHFIKELGKENELYGITARKFVTMKNPLGWYSKYLFCRWMKRHGFRFEEFYFCSERNVAREKLIGCKTYNVDVMIDDTPDVAMYLAEHGIKVLLFDTGYNQNVKHDNIFRVNDWKDVYKRICDMEDI